MRQASFAGVGIALGAALGAALDNIGIGVALGFIFGALATHAGKRKPHA